MMKHKPNNPNSEIPNQKLETTKLNLRNEMKHLKLT